MKVIINLLPPSKKEELKVKKHTGLILKIGLMAIFSIIVFVVFLFFSLSVLKIQKNSSEAIIVELGQSNVYKDVYDVQALIEKNYQQANQLSKELSQQKNYWELFNQLNQAVPQNIFLSELTIKDGTMSIKGFARNREELLEFKNKLEQNNVFNKVEAPISNFTLNENINFEFILEFS